MNGGMSPSSQKQVMEQVPLGDVVDEDVDKKMVAELEDARERLHVQRSEKPTGLDKTQAGIGCECILHDESAPASPLEGGGYGQWN